MQTKEKFAPHMGLANLMSLSIYNKVFDVKSIKRGPRGRAFGAIYGRIIEKKMLSPETLEKWRKIMSNMAIKTRPKSLRNVKKGKQVLSKLGQNNACQREIIGYIFHMNEKRSRSRRYNIL